MVDLPDRPQARFPPEEVPRVTAEVGNQLDRWGVGPGTTLFTGGARGVDIIAAEAALERGATVRLVLALAPADFVSSSVALPHSDWEERFRALLDQPAVDVEVVAGAEGDDIYMLTNERIIDRAREVDDHPLALVVWDGREGDGPGGTSDFVACLSRVSGKDHIVIVEPTPPEASTDSAQPLTSDP